ncbi:dendritic cell-specific transmembrane protein [Heterocephalus glaber]|uniref:Dendritic cell-specific transmembrane protein n=1 Tax=Heterocephalus glaber TaxID=10181 RepID=A0A0P6JBV6_HETGA|nr:dendritic cell-specific transmembrane protein [Heterocephalus glaber]XP_012929617.1 dendritic cell-specific transmembrane protein [Heterocephalus glaber]XP_012929618.1 dendritic cell-specific transmembrane protein [Heterocephalus glaber]XP_012929619.1 dendritic cell-specific transmembrane protein [Heterocephalus glaber]XP_021118456.1 dendritic cell-specific transmembrane protein [Heterocephalus glaber]XP_021118457.1 dendritic cell-specific transmembrane protein [Heterocephalus glaber]
MGVWTSGTDALLCLWEIYVLPRSPGWVGSVQHLGVCALVALVPASLLSAAFCWLLPPTAVLPAGWAVAWALLCCSKCARCFLLLFLLSCGLREGKKALIAAGTGIAIFGHIENIFHNFKGLLDSMTCNLRAKSFSIHFPLLKKYIEAIQWIYGLSTPPNLFDDLVSWSQTLEVSLSSPSHALEAQLNDTKGEVLGVLYHLVTTTEAASSLGQKLLTCAGLLLLLLGTGLFLKRFLGPRGWKHENVYITRQFVRFDEEERRRHRPCVLPLNRKERRTYTVLPSLRLTLKDRRALGLFLLPVLTHLCVWVLFAAVDYLLYRLIGSVGRQLGGLPGLEVRLQLHTERQGTQDIIHDSSFNISVFEPSCMPSPKFLLSKTWAPLGVILVLLVLLGLLSSILMQLKILVATSFYPSMEWERTQYLHAKLLKKRSEQLPGEVKGRQDLYFTKVHFWLPVLKVIGRKHMDSAPEDRW